MTANTTAGASYLFEAEWLSYAPSTALRFSIFSRFNMHCIDICPSNYLDLCDILWLPRGEA